MGAIFTPNIPKKYLILETVKVQATDTHNLPFKNRTSLRQYKKVLLLNVG